VSEGAAIPAGALERLARMRSGQTAAFSSALGVAEALSIREAGLEPIAQVMGVSYYKVGWQNMPWGSYGGGGIFGLRPGQTFELTTQSEAWNEARRLAVGRLLDEARAAGADAVVGVEVRRSMRDWATDLVEFVAVGTAVRSARYELALGDGGPLLSNLSGQDVAKLVKHGFWPAGIVGGSTVAYVASSWSQAMSSGGLFSSMRNQELPDFTRGLYDTRALAMQHVTQEAHALHAHGVVGVAIDRKQRERERDVGNTKYTDLIIEMHVLGTAIVEVTGGPADVPSPFTALPLN
jgi:uncharacterized protein YbjQ (UPF0145 family)